MSIKANELRVGNYFEHEGKYWWLSEIRHLINVKEWSLKGWYEATKERKDINFFDANPLPITPEILEKAGFVKDNTSQYGGYCIGVGEGEQIRIINDKNIGWHWPMHGYCRPKTTYLHQLQNLYFALTGEELIVKF